MESNNANDHDKPYPVLQIGLGDFEQRCDALEEEATGEDKANLELGRQGREHRQAIQAGELHLRSL
jgi:hypothetical protein